MLQSTTVIARFNDTRFNDIGGFGRHVWSRCGQIPLQSTTLVSLFALTTLCPSPSVSLNTVCHSHESLILWHTIRADLTVQKLPLLPLHACRAGVIPASAVCGLAQLEGPWQEVCYLPGGSTKAASIQLSAAAAAALPSRTFRDVALSPS